MNSAAALPLNGTVNISGNSTLTLNYNDGGSTANSNSSTINFASPGSPAINVPTGTATLSGAINSTGVGLTKTGSGTLLLTNAAGSSDTDSNNVNGGFVEVNSTYGGTDGYAGYSALGSGSVYLASAGSASGGGLWLNNVQVGVNQNQSKTDTLGDVYMYPGAALKGTGSGAALAHASANVELNWNKATGYSPGSVIFTTGTSPSDVLALHSEVEQTDPNYFQANENVNYTLNNSGYQGTTNANYLITAARPGGGDRQAAKRRHRRQRLRRGLVGRQRHPAGRPLREHDGRDYLGVGRYERRPVGGPGRRGPQRPGLQGGDRTPPARSSRSEIPTCPTPWPSTPAACWPSPTTRSTATPSPD